MMNNLLSFNSLNGRIRAYCCNGQPINEYAVDLVYSSHCKNVCLSILIGFRVEEEAVTGE